MRALLVPEIVMFFVAQFFASFARGPVFTGQINLYGVYAYGLGPQEIAVLATLTTVFAIPISLSSGWIMDHFGRKATLVPGFAMLLVAFGFLALTAVLQVPYGFFMAAYLAVYACTSMTGGNMQTLGSDIAPAHLRGRFYGVSQTLGHFGGPVATSAFALLAATVGYWSAFVFLGLTAGSAAFILATQVRDRLRDERKAARTPEPAVAEAAASANGAHAPLDGVGVPEASGASRPVGSPDRP
jgi:MFS family permease